ncbi:acyl carrier protein [Planotetraspora sp. A-T 1434]|uniref:phosphopantetheine-binding protein n=1 Tax=Planotetraspora sp. A-T 1434 TaxID=2979219 RepID=UPI0021BF2CCE|nr:acyl carrier protein [Planotetraspora sp. A-T 1434]MCT9935249.1 acyl carrier protein [Planotetraspora sp. A-T 1434]
MGDGVREGVIALLRESLQIEPGDDGSQDLSERGITSFQSVVLLMALEERFGITVPDDVLMLENFLTVDRIVTLVESLRDAPGLESPRAHG